MACQGAGEDPQGGIHWISAQCPTPGGCRRNQYNLSHDDDMHACRWFKQSPNNNLDIPLGLWFLDLPGKV